MFPVGGVGVMLLLIAVAGLLAAALTALLAQWQGWRWAVLSGLLLWSLAVIAVLTLIDA